MRLSLFLSALFPIAILPACVAKPPAADDTAVVVVDEDADGDGVLVGDDCDDTDAEVGAPSTWYEDADLDGFAGGALTREACDAPEGYYAEISDCDDLDASSYPGGTETCDGADNDCNGTVDDDPVDPSLFFADADGDGYGDPATQVAACELPSGYVANGDDCDDADAQSTQVASDVDCDGSPTDEDCDDDAPLIYPDAPELCDDIDNDCDGEVDEGLYKVQHYEWDDGPDGTADWITDYHYDADGNQVLVEVDNDGDGVVDFTISYTWNADGQMAGAGQDLDMDGIDDYVYEYYYDADGNQIRVKEVIDGVTSQVEDFTYDVNGNMTEHAYDSDGDGVADQRWSYTYDALGNQLMEEYDSDGNYLADEITTWSYDADGNVLEEATDSDADGVADSIVSYTYSTDGLLIRADYDQDGDGQLGGSSDYSLLYTWTADGSEASLIQFDSDSDGVGDRVYLERTYDVDGNRLTSTYDKNVDGAVDEIYTYTYDSDGNLIASTSDEDGDGNPEDSYQYDAWGNEIVDEWDTDSDGIIDSVETRTYTCIDGS
ncbi:MAG: MopE-related protein [Myxococcota bacterium]|nr:MopE-related protein [Myxococcota bacterium]